MTGSHWGRLAAFAAFCLALVLVAPPAAAVADVPPTRPDIPTAPSRSWAPARCATGGFEEAVLERDTQGAPLLRIPGWIQPCADPGHTNGFHIFGYYGDQAWHGRHPTPYQSLTAPTTFNVWVYARSELVPNGELAAFCLAYANNGRLACLAVGAAGPDEPLVVTPIPTDDPRVRIVVGELLSEETHPACGTCL